MLQGSNENESTQCHIGVAGVRSYLKMPFRATTGKLSSHSSDKQCQKSRSIHRLRVPSHSLGHLLLFHAAMNAVVARYQWEKEVQTWLTPEAVA
jgi:hypothetical protein